MRIKLAYGRDGLWVDLPDTNVTVLEPRQAPAVADEREAIRDALRAPLASPPLRDRVRSEDTVAIVFSDGTRPQPRRVMLETLLEELAHVPTQQITLINALGTHRPNTPSELEAMLGRELLVRCRLVQHDAWDAASLVDLGAGSRGQPIAVNADYLQANVRILTGFIEPHFFAGFSGGPKAVLPGLASALSVLANHSAALIEHPQATWGVTDGNPIWEQLREAALRTRPTFLLNVTLDRRQRITGVFAGEMLAAHASGARFAGEAALAPIAAPFDIVIGSNSGYPLDQNLYQAVKGMSAAARAVRPGGALIIAAECSDGLPAHGEYARLLAEASSPEEILERVRAFDPPRQDQWQVQIQAQIQLKADVYVKNSTLDEAALRRAHLQPCHSIEETLAALLRRYGADARIAVLPEGPMTVPILLP